MHGVVNAMSHWMHAHLSCFCSCNLLVHHHFPMLLFKTLPALRYETEVLADTRAGDKEKGKGTAGANIWASFNFCFCKAALCHHFHRKYEFNTLPKKCCLLLTVVPINHCIKHLISVLCSAQQNVSDVSVQPFYSIIGLVWKGS